MPPAGALPEGVFVVAPLPEVLVEPVLVVLLLALPLVCVLPEEPGVRVELGVMLPGAFGALVRGQSTAAMMTIAAKTTSAITQPATLAAALS